MLLSGSVTGIEPSDVEMDQATGISRAGYCEADALAAERQTDTVPGKAGEVPGEYLTLHHYLMNRYADVVLLTFDQIEGACLASDCQNARGPSRRGGRGPTETGT